MTTPLDELTEAMARAFVRAAGAGIVADDDNWPHIVGRHRKMCAEHPGYTDARSLVHDAFRNARTALSALDALGLVIVPGSVLTALEGIERALRKDASKPTVAGDDITYHLDGQNMYVALNETRDALAAASPYMRT